MWFIVSDDLMEATLVVVLLVAAVLAVGLPVALSPK